jgi:hypothetical protein
MLMRKQRKYTAQQARSNPTEKNIRSLARVSSIRCPRGYHTTVQRGRGRADQTSFSLHAQHFPFRAPAQQLLLPLAFERKLGLLLLGVSNSPSDEEVSLLLCVWCGRQSGRIGRLCRRAVAANGGGSGRCGFLFNKCLLLLPPIHWEQHLLRSQTLCWHLTNPAAAPPCSYSQDSSRLRVLLIHCQLAFRL